MVHPMRAKLLRQLATCCSLQQRHHRARHLGVHEAVKSRAHGMQSRTSGVLGVALGAVGGRMPLAQAMTTKTKIVGFQAGFGGGTIECLCHQGVSLVNSLVGRLLPVSSPSSVTRSIAKR